MAFIESPQAAQRSNTLHCPREQASQTKMPQCTWEPSASGDAILATTGPDAPLVMEARRASLQASSSSPWLTRIAAPTP